MSKAWALLALLLVAAFVVWGRPALCGYRVGHTTHIEERLVTDLAA